MGQCGCGEGYDYRLKAPRGWYLIKIYPGCTECETPAGVHIDHETERHGFAENLGDYPITDGCGQGLAVVSAESVKAALVAEIGGARLDDITVGELVEFDDLHENVFRRAVDGAMRPKTGDQS